LGTKRARRDAHHERHAGEDQTSHQSRSLPGYLPSFDSVSLAIVRCSCKVGSVLAAQALRSASSAFFDASSNSFTSFSWSLTIIDMYALSNAAPSFLESVSFCFSLFFMAASMALVRSTPLSVASCLSSSLALL